MPEISIIMPAYNAEEFIAEAIKSILDQDFKDFEFIIINDGSDDATEIIIHLFHDARIRYYRHEENLGNNITRNEGITLATGKYIAIMDSDDISMPYRLRMQYEYLEKHWETDFVGGAVEWFGDAEAKIEYPTVNPEYLKAALFFKNKILQPTIMFRKKMFEKYALSWKAEWENMGDYELWFTAKQKGLCIENLKTVLVKYRKSAGQIGTRNIKDREEKLLKFLHARLSLLGLNFNSADEALLFSFIRTRIVVDESTFQRIREMLRAIESANNKRKLYSRHAFKAALLFYYIRLGKYYFKDFSHNIVYYMSYLAWKFFRAGLRASVLFLRNEVLYR